MEKNVKYLIISSLIFFGITLIITKILLEVGLITHELRGGISLHIFVGLLAYNIIYFGIKYLFDKDSKKFKESIIIAFCITIALMIYTNRLFIENWKTALIIQLSTICIFGYLVKLILKEKIKF